MERRLAFSLFLLLGAAGPQPAADGVDTEALMARIEAQVRMSEGAPPLARITRLYRWETRDGPRKVIGLLTSFAPGDPPHRPPGRYWMAPDAMPGIEDGGCGVVNLVYDLASDRIEALFCNGVA